MKQVLTLSALGAALIAITACKSAAVDSSPSAAPTATTTPSALPSTTRIEPTPDPITHPCVVLQARFKKRKDEATGTCEKDADCGCYNPVHGDLGCGGVTDSVTSIELSKMEAEFHRLGCVWPHQCAPWACAPKCARGRCSR